MKFRSLLFCWMLLLVWTALPARGQTEPLRPGDQAKAGQPAAAEKKTVSVEELVAEALRSNPEIQAAEHRVAAFRARVPQAKTLPDPTVTIGWLGEPLPFDVRDNFPPSFRGFTASQQFPFPGKLKLRGRIADRESEAAWWDYEAARRHVAAQVKIAYYEYSYFHKALEIIENNRVLLEKLTNIAEARYEAGKGLQQDVLKGQVELSQLLGRITILTEQQHTAVARLNTLLNRDPETPLAAPAPLQQTKLSYTLDNLYRLARSHDTGVQRAQRMIERAQDALQLSRKSYDPDFSVSYMYQQRPMLADTQGLFVTLNIPIFYKSKQREAVKEATESLLSERSLRADRETTLNFQVKEQFLAAQQADKLAVLFSQAIVPQSSQALQSSELAYESDKADFLTMLSNFINLLDFQVNYYRQISNYQLALARLEPLVGVELTK
jgi:cobalt-zinc-cadmium efflux system outer membrane protein